MRSRVTGASPRKDAQLAILATSGVEKVPI